MTMKKISLVLFILLSSFLFFSLVKVEAQTPTPIFTIPGQNCGIAEDPLKNQCCNLYRPDFQPPSLPGGLSALVPFTQAGINLLKDNFIQPMTNKFSNLNTPCLSGVPSLLDSSSPSCKCINPITPNPGSNLSALNEFCQKQSTPIEAGKCLNCANQGGIWTGFGCTYTDVKEFIEKTVFGFGIGLAGGFSLLCIVYAAFMMQSSQGNPEKLKKAQEMITSCIMGLMLIIFSVFILRLIGVNILRIPGFG